VTAAVGATTEVVLALDIGTSGARAWQSWPDLALSALDCVRQVIGESGARVAALVLSGTASCLVSSWTEAGELRTGDVILWSDRRAVVEQRELTALVEASYPRTLCPAHVSYWPAKLQWLAGRDPQRFGTKRLGGAKDLLFELLCGERWTDPMTAAATGVFDSSSWEWDDELLGVGLVRKDQLPDVNDATRSAPMRRDQARALGLPSGTPVVLGGMDGPLAPWVPASRSGPPPALVRRTQPGEPGVTLSRALSGSSAGPVATAAMSWNGPTTSSAGACWATCCARPSPSP